ncbi:MAG: hypothetical protein LC713_07615, partial [Actinobacteria bacterium]|nr:hypothetical protein [Actinomycetota bacterium]
RRAAGRHVGAAAAATATAATTGAAAAATAAASSSAAAATAATTAAAVMGTAAAAGAAAVVGRVERSFAEALAGAGIARGQRGQQQAGAEPRAGGDAEASTGGVRFTRMTHVTRI